MGFSSNIEAWRDLLASQSAWIQMLVGRECVVEVRRLFGHLA